MAKSIKVQIADTEEAISKLQVKLEELKFAAANEVSEDKLLPGVQVVFVYGTGDNKKDVTGTIIGVKPADPADKKSVTLLNVAVGEGFEAQTIKVAVAKVKKIVAAEAPAEQAAE